jgi:hypothetical protein
MEGQIHAVQLYLLAGLQKHGVSNANNRLQKSLKQKITMNQWDLILNEISDHMLRDAGEGVANIIKASEKANMQLK